MHLPRRLIVINVPHVPARHRPRRPLMLWRDVHRGLAVCFRGRIRGMALVPKFKGD